MITASRHSSAVAEIFAGIFGDALQQEPRTEWELHSCGAPITARIEESWLVMSAPVPCDASPDFVLGISSALPGAVKLSLSANGGAQIRVEVPLDEEESGAQIREAWSGLESALASLRGEAAHAMEIGNAPAVTQEDLKRVCEEAGWTPTLRGEDSCVVELECPGTFIQASLAPHGCGVRVSVPLGNIPETETESAAATGILLLNTCGAVRLVRPVWESGDGCVKPGIEIIFSAVPSAAQLAHALSGLSVACQCCAEEAKALRDPNVARQFLALSKTKTGNQET